MATTWRGSGSMPGRCRNGFMRRCAPPGLRSNCWRRAITRTMFKIMPVKTDRKDARGIAELMRMGWFRPVHCKSMEAQETRALLTARKLVQKAMLEVEASLRGILRGFGLKVGKATAVRVRATIR